MALENDYERLFSHWLEEFQEKELTPLSAVLFSRYNQLKKSISDIDKNASTEIKNQLVESYEQNVEYLLKDFAKIREIKIINAALALQEIDFDNVIEAEKLFYMNLVGAIKGFKKVKSLAKFDDVQVAAPVKEAEFKSEGINYDEEFEKIQQDMLEMEEELVSEKGEKEYKYTLIRFIKKTPPLVGIDLLNYGPFDDNDLAHLPYKNAKILLSEKFAEEINI